MSEAYNLADKSLFIGTPAYDFKISIKLAVALAELAQAAVRHGIKMRIGSVCGNAVITKARNQLVAEFLASDSEYLLFVDADIGFTAMDVLRLMAWVSEPDHQTRGD